MVHTLFGTPLLLLFAFLASVVFFVNGPGKKIYIGLIVFFFIVSAASIYSISLFYEEEFIQGPESAPVVVSYFIYAVFFSTLLQILTFFIFLIHKLFGKKNIERSREDRTQIKKFVIETLKSKTGVFGLVTSLSIIVVAKGGGDNLPFAIVNVLLLVGIVSLNLLILGKKRGIRNLVVFMLLFLIGNTALITFLFSDSKNAAYGHMVFSSLSAIVGLVYPLWLVVFNPEQVRWIKMPAIFLFLIVASMGSVYLPMKMSMNGLIHMEKGMNTIANYGEENDSSYMRCRLYQNDNLFDELPREQIATELDSACSQSIEFYLSKISDPNTVCSHVTFRFWVDQLVKSVYGLRDGLYGFGVCRVSSLEPKKNTSTERIVKWYSVFINIVWFNALFTITLVMIKKIVNFNPSSFPVTFAIRQPSFADGFLRMKTAASNMRIYQFLFGVFEMKVHKLTRYERAFLSYLSSMNQQAKKSEVDIDTYILVRAKFPEVQIYYSEIRKTFVLNFADQYFDAQGPIDISSNELVKVTTKF